MITFGPDRIVGVAGGDVIEVVELVEDEVFDEVDLDLRVPSTTPRTMRPITRVNAKTKNSIFLVLDTLGAGSIPHANSIPSGFGANWLG